jgi:hypothetical protein
MSRVPFTLPRPTPTELEVVVGDGVSWLVVVWLTKTGRLTVTAASPRRSGRKYLAL